MDKSGNNPKWQTTLAFQAETVEIEHELMLPEPLVVRGKDAVLTKSLGRVLVEGERLTIVYPIAFEFFVDFRRTLALSGSELRSREPS